MVGLEGKRNPECGTSGSVLRPAALGVLFFVSLAPGCSARRELNFDALASADRIHIRDLTGTTDRQVKQIRDAQQIAAAVEFIQRYRTGWSEPFGGSPVPMLMLDFFKNDERLGGFGFDRERIIADPVKSGWWSLPIRSEEREAFLQSLGVKFPG